MAVKVQRLVEYEQNNEIEVLLFADTKGEVSPNMQIDGIPKGKVISYGSSLITADGDLAFLKSDGTWNFTKNGGGSDPNLEDKTVDPDFSDGDVVVEPSEGYDGLSSVTIEKDSDLIAANVKKDVTINGITGTYGNFETKSLEPDFSNGDVTVSPTSGYDALSSVTIEKDADLVAENIKKDVNVFGVVGTYEGSGGNYNATVHPDSDGEFTSYSIANNMTALNVPVGTYYLSLNGECPYLTTVILPEEELSYIGENCFNSCVNLTSIEIPSSVVHVGSYAFQGCSNLTSAILNEGIEEIGQQCFENCSSLTEITIPSSITSIGDDCFSNCSSLESATWLPDVDIPQTCFSGCSSLTEITITGTITSIGYIAFSFSGLTEFIVPSSVTSIGAQAFQYCSDLTTITFLGNTELSDETFLGCSSLENVTFSNTTTYIGNSSTAQSVFKDCSSLTEITIPNSVISIAECAFDGCTSLSTINWGTGLTFIPDGCFYRCAIVNLTIPSGVEDIGEKAFAYNTTLRTVEIPSTVNMMDTDVFEGCSNLTITVHKAEGSIQYAPWGATNSTVVWDG